ncbi:TAXI family TRAP transporter solute-binding subunit [Methylobacterium iners]|uniref:C4-dicarboxylate ABC transporter substrate-binding protein n=1 Tax=Methylobacterium iners TaxID=418707 RepID=A0ABQ4RVU8_9HYPH|nr:TAXI family TRAP transporter solute-binding subunit [Methylobacterium iners]GJD94958.1 hypothetical protein OCOJLMKI_2166 [Methylobacterium iners]
MPSILLRREWLLILLALGLAVVAATIVYLSRPNTLTVAVGPRDGAEAGLMTAYAQALARNREDIRLKVLQYADVRDSAAALQANKADLAVVRPDVLLPENGLTLAVLHEEALILAAPSASGIASFPDLSRKRLGIVERHGADQAFVANLLTFYDFTAASEAETEPGKLLPAGRVALVTLRAGDVTRALEEGRVDAVAVIASPVSKPAISTVRAVEAASADKGVTLIAVPDSEAIIQRSPELQATTIPAGTFGGRPQRPDEDIKTVGASYRLMARGNVNRYAVASVTQHLFEWRGRLAPVAPLANQMKAPDFESTVAATSARLPNHPGAVDYFEREQQTLFERYEDYIYLLAFFGGTIGSGVAWLGQRLARKRRERVDVVLDRLLDILKEVRAARSKADLDGLVAETDDLVADVVRQARERNMDNRTVSALILAIDAVHAAVNDARRTLSGAEAEPGEARARTARVLGLHRPAAE